MKRFFAAGALVLFTSFASPAAAASKEELLAVVSAIDSAPTREDLLAAGAGAAGQNLRSIIHDRTLPRYPRARAVAMLAHFPTAANVRELRAVVEDDTFDDIEVRIQAMAALGRVQSSGALPLLHKMSAHRNPALRAAANRGVARITRADRADRAAPKRNVLGQRTNSRSLQ